MATKQTDGASADFRDSASHDWPKTQPVVKSYLGLKRYSNPANWNFHLPNPFEIVYWWMSSSKMGENKEEEDKYLTVKTVEQVDAPVSDKVLVTWLGHATVLVQMDGVSILTDPVFSQRCSPSQSVGPKRIREAPCQVEDLNNVDIVLISHNHYDHLDKNSVHSINKKFGEHVKWFVPVGLKSWMQGILGCDCRNVTELSWWDEISVDIPVKPAANSAQWRQLKIASTPACHWSGRNPTGYDRYASLWCSWCVAGPSQKFFFAGDTGYPKTDKIFEAIGKYYGPFDLAAIPIGAYKPREFMECQHVDPEEAVRMHQDVGAKKSIGIHWGTFVLTSEAITDPPKDLAKALEEQNLSTEDFFVVCPGETKEVPTS